jgi:hypothetical protein
LLVGSPLFLLRSAFVVPHCLMADSCLFVSIRG